jgi:hypothetical protein
MCEYDCMQTIKNTNFVRWRNDAKPLLQLTLTEAELVSRYLLTFRDDRDELSAFRLALASIEDFGSVMFCCRPNTSANKYVIYCDSEIDTAYAIRFLKGFLQLSDKDWDWSSMHME